MRGILQEMRRRIRVAGGFTYADGQFPTTGYSVGVHEGDWRVIDAPMPATSEIYEAMRDLPKVTFADGFGAWVSSRGIIFDPIAIFHRKGDAMLAATTFNQTHIYDLARDEVLEVKYNG